MTVRQSGFTLMEMLVALALFGIIALISSQLLYQTVETTATMYERGDRLAEFHRAMSIMNRDFHQIASRKVRDDFGLELAPLTLNDGRLLQFSRLGWSNPLQLQRSNIQRVEYAVTEDNILIRRYWNVLDRTTDSIPIDQELLFDVGEIEFVVLTSEGEAVANYPEQMIVPDDQEGEDEPIRALAIQMQMYFEPLGPIYRLWTIPALPEIQGEQNTDEDTELQADF